MHFYKMKIVVLGDGLLGKEIINQTGWDYYSRKKDNLNIEREPICRPAKKTFISFCILHMRWWCPLKTLRRKKSFWNTQLRENRGYGNKGRVKQDPIFKFFCKNYIKRQKRITPWEIFWPSIKADAIPWQKSMT